MLDQTHDDNKLMNLKCKHSICRSCFQLSINSYLDSNKSLSELNCPISKCSFKINLIYLQINKLLKQFQFVKISKYFQQNLSIDQNYAKYTCPSPTCRSVIFELNLKSRPEHYSIQCSCFSLVCGHCGDLFHYPVSCQNYKKWVGFKTKSENLLSNDWIHSNTKKCPKCSIVIGN